jgi:transcriptional regulator with XRE-family HTH domain
VHPAVVCTSWKVQRVMAELTQRQAAGRARMSVRRLSRIERGIDKPKDDEAERLARAMPVQRLATVRIHETLSTKVAVRRGEQDEWHIQGKCNPVRAVTIPAVSATRSTRAARSRTAARNCSKPRKV